MAMRVVTVGTGTVVPDPARGSACHWIDQADTRVLVDCGAGAAPGLARVPLPWGEIDHLLISHFHPDHIVEIPFLLFSLKHGLATPRSRPLRVWGPEGTIRIFDTFALTYGDWVVEPGFDLTIRELQPGGSARLGDLEVKVASTPHTQESVAYRFEAGGSAMGYTGDTGPSTELANFFYEVDLLLAECSLPEELVQDNHLSPLRLARLAVEAAARRVAVTHVYPQLNRLDIPELMRRGGFAGDIIVVEDGSELRV